METSDWGLARTIEAQVLASHARQIAAEIRFAAVRHSQIAGELFALARHRPNDDQSRLVAERLQRESDETDARSRRLIAMGNEIEARRRQLLDDGVDT